MLAAILLLVLTANGRPDEYRLRIAWGGGSERQWQATITTSDGRLADFQPLGIEADEPGSMWLEGEANHGAKKLCVHQRSPRTYDGVDLSVSASSAAKLQLRFTPVDAPDQSTNLEIPLSFATGEFVNKELDSRGNRLILMRAPGDVLRLRFSRDHLVFAPGETFKFTVEPYGLPQVRAGRIRLRVQLVNRDGKELWSQQREWNPDHPESVPLEVAVPSEEGVYDVVIVAMTGPNWSQAVRQPLNAKRTLAERRLQLLVLNGNRSPVGAASREFAQLAEIDPTNPRGHDKLNKLPQLQLTRGRLPWTWKSPLGNDRLQSRRHVLGEMGELAPNAESPDVSWEAYWLPIAQPGRPHFVEVEYPSDVPQTLGLSILEPNPSGSLSPLKVDWCVDNFGSPADPQNSPRLQRHRLIFWPWSNSPLLLVSNGRDRAPAVFGKIRVFSGGERLPRMIPDKANQRLLVAYMDRPLLCQTFQGGESLDVMSGRSLDDWATFYESGSRLVEHLHHSGHNALMLGVLADGSTIYPSSLLQPTPRYDTGAFFATGQDPVRKDVLEMLLRLFDREDLQLIPVLDFAAPLPELEALRRAGGREAEGIEWIGAEGNSLPATWPPRRGQAPYYNLLHPRVQQAMLAVFREIAARYARHPSFTGIAVRLSADGYAQLPGPEWGLDDVTITRFQRDTKLQVPGTGRQRFAERAAWLANEPYRRAWLDWRAAQVADFYHRVAEELVGMRAGARLYLAGAGMFNGPETQSVIRPTLPRRLTTAAALLHVGIDVRCFRQGGQQNVVLLRPEAVTAAGHLASQAAEIELRQTADFDGLFQGLAAPGSFFFHPPREVHIASFQAKSPFRASAAWLISQAVPAEMQNRRRFIHSLATLDAQVLVDGGLTLPMGQEELLRTIVTAYRMLPATRFSPIASRQQPDATQPVTFRQASYNGRCFLYVVNDAPFSTTARLRIEAGRGCRIEELTGARKVPPLQSDSNGLYWEVALEPYDLIAVRFTEPNVKYFNPHASWPASANAALSASIRRLGARAAALRNPTPLDVIANPGFETTAEKDPQISDWAVTTGEDVSIRLDKNDKHSGQHAVKVQSSGPIACLVSRPMNIPPTGRLAISVWLRVSDPAKQPPLRLAVDGKLHGREYYRFAQVGLAAAGQPAVPLQSEWAQYVFQVDDLPMEGLSTLRARFDLMGPGEVWVDDVQVFHLAFSKVEMVELSKLITLSDIKLKNGQIADCLDLLDGYWPRFLEANVPLPAGVDVAARPKPAEDRPPDRTGLLNRVKDMLPETLKR